MQRASPVNDDDRKQMTHNDDLTKFAEAVAEWDGQPKENVLLVWNLPTVRDLQKLRQEFITASKQKIPELDLVCADAKDRTQYAERMCNSGRTDESGNENVLLCSYMLISVSKREHFYQLIRVWNRKEFQGRTLNVIYSIDDRQG